ncbi:MAG: hypothetical protein GX877_06475 [Bacteroidales bacterium]|nr:hypothetical protein [Bacteroidales bacterium]
MKYSQHTFEKYPTCTVHAASFYPNQSPSGAEHHLIFTLSAKEDLMAAKENCIAVMHACIEEWLAQEPYQKATCVFARYFLKNSAELRPQVHARRMFPAPCALSFIEQPPANNSTLVVWLYLQEPEAFSEKYTHFWTTEKFHLGENVAQQTKKLLTDYQQWLQAKGCHMKDHCMRTWFFISNIDVNYPAFAKTRTDYFREIGMDETTHYIASTGIEGENGAPGSYVTMDAYAVKGLNPSQVTHLQALTHLSPTNMYGVTFERGVALQFDDRKHIYISGTASIDAKGNVVEEGNVRGQTLRMWENVEVLLSAANATWNNVAQIIVYLRHQSDLSLVRALFKNRFPDIPTVIVMGKVCRPAWLIEMECIAIMP